MYRVYDKRDNKTLFTSEIKIECLSFQTGRLVDLLGDDEKFDEEFENIEVEEVDVMKTMKKKIELNQTLLMKDGTTDYVEDYDGDFYFLEKSNDPILPYTIVDVIVENK